MRPSANFLDIIHPENLKLTLSAKPCKQSQNAAWHINNPSGYKDYDLFVCYGGAAEFRANGTVHLLTPGHAFLATPGMPLYTSVHGRDNFDAIAQHFELKLFGSVDLFSLIKFKQLVQFTNWDFVSAAFTRYETLNASGEKKILQQSLFSSVIAEFIYDSYLSENETVIDHNYFFIIKMMSYIDSHLTDDNAVAEAFSLSPYGYDYTATLFKKYVGVTPKKYFLNMRLRQSKDLLLQGYSVREAAINSGFKDELYFSRLFKKYEQVSPSEYKASTAEKASA